MSRFKTNFVMREAARPDAIFCVHLVGKPERVSTQM
jgi:hypothetical protein